MRAELMKLDNKIIKVTLKAGIGVNILSYGYVMFSLVFLKKLPLYFHLFDDKTLLILIIEIVGIAIGYLMMIHYKVFTKAANEIFGLIFLWPIASLTLMLLQIDRGFMLSVLLFVGGGSILLSILKFSRLKNIRQGDILISQKNEKRMFKPKFIVLGVIIWFLLAILILILFLKL
jgi:hypothetical protein